MNLKLAAVAAVRTLDDVTLISEAIARAVHRLKREEESEQEETISCTASSTTFVKVMMRPALTQLIYMWIAFVNMVCQRNSVGLELLPSQYVQKQCVSITKSIDVYSISFAGCSCSPSTWLSGQNS